MSADLARDLSEGARSLGLSLTPEDQRRLLDYLALLQKWNRVYNLTAVRDPAEMLTHHLLDSLAALPALNRHAPGATAILDVGSGGGLPGVVLALCRPDWQVTCVDAVAKKTAFVQQVAGNLGLSNLRGVHSRVQDLGATWPLITCRAFASLGDFTHWSASVLSPGGVWAAMKGKYPQDEIDALPASVQVFHVEPLNVPGLEAERCLVWMRCTGQT
jgi:16S rRNA (guanine527-N7)-methyltransferase